MTRNNKKKDSGVKSNANTSRPMSHSIINGALKNDRNEVLAALAENPDCINEQTPVDGLTATHIAAGLGNLTMVELLTEQPGLDLFLKDIRKRDSLDVAIVAGHEGIIRRLFQRRAALKPPEQDGGPGGSTVFDFKPR